jgi:nucleotide-binding universal stress UspA family protein
MNVLYVPSFPYDDRGGIPEPRFVVSGRKELAAMLDRLGAGSQARLFVGDPGESTIEAVRARAMSDGNDLVMVGPLGSDTLVKLVFGSDRCVHAGSELPVAVVPRSAWSTAPPRSIPSRLTVGFHGSDPAVAALAWAVSEANRRDATVHAILAWCEGDYGGLGGSVRIAAGFPSTAGRSACHLAADSLSSCGVTTSRVRAIARRGVPAATLIRAATGSDLLAIGTGRSAVCGHRTLGAITLGCLTGSPVPVVLVSCPASGPAAGLA